MIINSYLCHARRYCCSCFAKLLYTDLSVSAWWVFCAFVRGWEGSLLCLRSCGPREDVCLNRCDWKASLSSSGQVTLDLVTYGPTNRLSIAYLTIQLWSFAFKDGIASCNKAVVVSPLPIIIHGLIFDLISHAAQFDLESFGEASIWGRCDLLSLIELLALSRSHTLNSWAHICILSKLLEGSSLLSSCSLVLGIWKHRFLIAGCHNPCHWC